MIVKQPFEAIHADLPVGSAVVAILATTAEARGLVVGSAPIGAVATVVSAAISVALTGGTDGERYLVTVRYQAAGGDQREAELEVAVVDGRWVMPDGGAPYLSIAEFAGFVGLRETVEMTDGEGTGRIDRPYLVAALSAAQGKVELALAARYALPLAEVPSAVKVMIADLARARLYPRGAPEGVADLVRSAERTLERIASGALPLPLPAGGIAAPADSDAPVLISKRGRRAYPRGLDDFAC